jgi:hypothetical protein
VKYNKIAEIFYDSLWPGERIIIPISLATYSYTEHVQYGCMNKNTGHTEQRQHSKKLHHSVLNHPINIAYKTNDIFVKTILQSYVDF